MRSPFTDNTATPLPGLPLTDICPRAGLINPLAYNAIEIDKSLVGAGISSGDDVYVLSTADVESGDLAVIKTPDGILVRFVHWFTNPTGKIKVRLESANPEIKPRIYDYDDTIVRTRWRVVWVCRHGDHSTCSAYKQPKRVI